jgi:quercetin dioxygenase-like cupin family protein
MPSENDILIVHAAEGRNIGKARVVKAGLEHGTGGLTLMEMRLPPGDGSPPHIHHDADEAWYVLEGELTFYSGAWSAVAGAGDFVLVPRGAVHNYTVTSAIPARYLEMFAPAGKERFFEELSALYAACGDEPVPPEERQALWRRHAMTLLDP